MKIKLSLFIALFPLLVFGQENQDSTHSDYKNTLKWNLTPLAFGGIKNIVLSYERTLPHNQSFSVNGGFLSYPQFSTSQTGIFRNITQTKNYGYTVSGDYRFYLSRNKYPAPDGIYWGPFINYYQLNTDFEADYYEDGVYQATGELSTDVKIAFVGIQLGYQFIFWKRYSVDLILFGPAVGMYNASFTASGNIVPNEEIQEVIDFLKSKYPVVRDLVNTGNANGHGTTWGAGFRYAIKIGYRF